MVLTGAQVIMECLLEQGVDTVFGYPGGSVLNIYDALYEYRDRINHIRTAHEQGAAMPRMAMRGPAAKRAFALPLRAPARRIS